MRIRRLVKRALKSHIFVYFLLLIASFGIIIASRSLSDRSYEISSVGSLWLNGAIPYVQAWSHYSPLTIFLGGLYQSFVSAGFVQYLFELILFFGVFFGLRALLAQNDIGHKANNATLSLFATLPWVPGLWQYGITPTKLALIFGILFSWSIEAWLRSGPSYWLFGITNKNWRLATLASVSAALLIFVSPLYIILIIPATARVVQKCGLSMRTLRTASLFTVPAILLFWIHTSFFAPRRVLQEWFNATVLNLSITAFGPVEASYAWYVALIALVIVAYLAIIALHNQNFRTKPALWLSGFVTLGSAIFMPVFFIENSMVILAMGAYLVTRQSTKMMRPHTIVYALCAMLLIALPLRVQLSQKTYSLQQDANTLVQYITSQNGNETNVFMYGSAPGLYVHGLSNPSRYFDMDVFRYDSEFFDFGDKLRGDLEGNPPKYIIYPTSPSLRSPSISRLEEYLTRHYSENITIGDFKILVRKSRVD